MFDIGFSELIVIAVVALIVIGPERLPKVARTAGHLLGRLQRYVNDVKSDINREMQLDELKKLQAQVEESARSIERDVGKELQSAETSLNQAAQGLTDAAPSPGDASPAVAAPPSAEAPPVAAAPASAASTAQASGDGAGPAQKA
ncbi:MAG: twin arginine-targeting protein translocase TatB [Candidatus Accumulibacter sp. 66-26]|nr:Sec-independent protein translocase subunit TatB [Accumulibacter sp.]OJW51661.1 MAG: twin arginine-targeting protein translocase TatB [Candidatus Accumulibacter sp. 66-26]